MPDCIIPAAGRSSRMGDWKPSLPWNGNTIVGKVVSEALEAGCRVIVVGGYRFSELIKLLPVHNKIVQVKADDWEQGMDVSIKAALKWVKTPRFFIVPVDMPLIVANDYRTLEELPETQTVRPSFSGVPGHPVLLNSSLIPALEKAAPGTPLRVSLSQFSVRTVPWDHDGVIRDIDLPEVYIDSMPGR